jgi:hypothetical protein
LNLNLLTILVSQTSTTETARTFFDFGSFGGAALLISNFIKKTIHYWTNANTLSNPHYTVSNKVIF